MKLLKLLKPIRILMILSGITGCSEKNKNQPSNKMAVVISTLNNPWFVVLSAILAAGKADKIKIYGFDGADDALIGIAGGKIAATVMQFPVLMSRTSADPDDEQSISKSGQPGFGMANVGTGKDSPGSKVELSAACSSDPYNNLLLYNWYFFKEASTFSGNVAVQNNTTATPTVSIPSNANGKDLHIILELRDSGSPMLFAYRRVIIHVVYATGINDIMLNGTQSAFTMQNYPNPSGEITNIKVSLPADGDIEADIFNLDGILVENIYVGFLNKGTHILSWKPESSEEGIFICKLNYEDQEYYSKIIQN